MQTVLNKKTKSNKLTILASELLSQGGIEEGLEALKRSARIGDKSDMQNYLQIASNLYIQKDYEHAKIFIETFLEHWSAAEAHFILAAVENALGRKEKSIKNYEAGIKIYKGVELSPYHECAELYIKLSDNYKASEIYKLVLAKNQNDKTALSFLASYYTTLKNYNNAIGYYKSIIDFNLAEYSHYQYYGLCLYELGEYKKSEQMYITAMEKYPVLDKSSLFLKDIRNRDLKDSYKNIEDSEKKYKKALEEKPTSTNYFHLGNIEFIKGHYTKAAELYEKAKEAYHKYRE